MLKGVDEANTYATVSASTTEVGSRTWDMPNLMLARIQDSGLQRPRPSTTWTCAIWNQKPVSSIQTFYIYHLNSA